jgi:hypothetical protein
VLTGVVAAWDGSLVEAEMAGTSTTANVTYDLIKPLTALGQGAFVPVAIAQAEALADKSDSELYGELFDRFDADRDGHLSAAEWDAFTAAARPGRVRL